MAALIAELMERLGSAGLALRGDPWRQALLQYERERGPDAQRCENGAGRPLPADRPRGLFRRRRLLQPESRVLGALRRGLVDDADGWQEALSALAEAELALESENMLVRPTKGFFVAPPELETALKLKS